VDHTGLEASPAGAQGPNRVAGDINQEAKCGRKAVEHGGRSYRSLELEEGRPFAIAIGIAIAIEKTQTDSRVRYRYP